MYFLKYRYFNVFFLFIFLFNILALDHIPDYRIVAKPLIMASLLGLYISKVHHQSHILITAMIFALLGDAFLMFNSDDFFVIGLGSFLIMQLLYATVFYKDRSASFRTFIVSATVMGLIAGGILMVLWSGLGAMRWPVTLYTAAISVMVVTATSRRQSLSAVNWVIAGVILFVISDSLIAVGKFMSPLPMHHYLVMITYMIAQYLIITGLMEVHVLQDEVRNIGRQ